MWVNLGRALDTKGWSNAELARRLDVKPSVVSRYYRPNFNPSAETLIKWADVIGCPVGDLFDKALDSSEGKRQIPRPKSAIKGIHDSKPKKRRKSI